MSSKIAMSNGLKELYRCAYCMIDHRKYAVISNSWLYSLIPQKLIFSRGVVTLATSVIR